MDCLKNITVDVSNCKQKCTGLLIQYSSEDNTGYNSQSYKFMTKLTNENWNYKGKGYDFTSSYASKY